MKCMSMLWEYECASPRSLVNTHIVHKHNALYSLKTNIYGQWNATYVNTERYFNNQKIYRRIAYLLNCVYFLGFFLFGMN